jgi:hypothetical protein
MLSVAIMEGDKCEGTINVSRARLYIGSRFPFCEGVKMSIVAIELLPPSNVGPDALVQVDYVVTGAIDG